MRWVLKVNWVARPTCRVWMVPGRDLTDSVNKMAGNLTAQVRNIAEVTTAVANGDFVEEDHGGRTRGDPCN